MIAPFVRLKLQLLANMFRRSPWQVVGISIGLLVIVRIVWRFTHPAPPLPPGRSP